ncbi:hypothetical protein ACJMK2_005985 [Sinanodonta woodiana]|uniref:Uncharacterized protein n=1 Tax=Sinanodonta woodiana TaxID=1069815 RepID=A0ABD3VRR3_SINWO
MVVKFFLVTCLIAIIMVKDTESAPGTLRHFIKKRSISGPLLDLMEQRFLGKVDSILSGNWLEENRDRTDLCFYCDEYLRRCAYRYNCDVADVRTRGSFCHNECTAVFFRCRLGCLDHK